MGPNLASLGSLGLRNRRQSCSSTTKLNSIGWGQSMSIVWQEALRVGRAVRE